MKRIAIIGECMIELNGSPFGDMRQSYGGDSLNTAVYLARTAGETVAVDYISALGCDALSEGMLARWQEEGVNTDHVLRDPLHQPGLYLIQLDDQGERTFLYWRDQSAAKNMMQHPQFPEIETHLRTVDMVYLSGISLAILPAADRQKLIDLLKELSANNVQIAFDSNYRPALWKDATEAQQCYQQIFAMTDIALVTNDDERTLWCDVDDEMTLNRLQTSGVKQAVLKMGAEGCLYQHFEQEKREWITTTPVEHVVDTTSAGDAFNAGFLAGYLSDKPPGTSALQGHQLAGTIIQHKGAVISAEATKHINFNT
ncbi:MAG: sugar kinase [Aliivibrio sp.]|uniref:sugar kinase n=1 Tax=Aliivibrio sp. TaxID=1872443 RepID=UPI001A4B5B36|nr:sugar kinase [Aliivibrio sp.]